MSEWGNNRRTTCTPAQNVNHQGVDLPSVSGPPFLSLQAGIGEPEIPFSMVARTSGRGGSKASLSPVWHPRALTVYPMAHSAVSGKKASACSSWSCPGV